MSDMSVLACMWEEKKSQTGEVSVSYFGLRGIAVCVQTQEASTGGSGDFTEHTVFVNWLGGKN